MVSASAIRQQRWRSRQDRDRLCLTIEVDATRLIAVLQDANLVSDDPTREELAAVVERWVAQEITRYESERWLMP